MTINFRYSLSLLATIIVSLAIVACESSDSDLDSGSSSNSDSGTSTDSSSSSTYTLSNMEGYWFSLDYDSVLSQINTYVSQGNASMVKSRDDVYGFKISSTGSISEVVLKVSTSSTSGDIIHNRFFVSGEFVYWMLSDVGSYLSNVSIVDNEIISGGSVYFTITSSTVISYFGGGFYIKK